VRRLKTATSNADQSIFPPAANRATMNKFRNFIEWHMFGVCTAIGEKMGIATTQIRKWFIYTSLLTMGSPIIIYMILAFWMNMKRYIHTARRNPLFD
jgi:phage shock protein PspC (stress-responsive transcriptional regulator)